MANMSYCRFVNTFNDLDDCVDALENDEVESQSEKNYAEKMRKCCENYIRAYDNWKGRTFTV